MAKSTSPRGANGPNERAKKADALDSYVKTETAKIRAGVDAKIAKLRALRLAEEANIAAAAASEPTKKTTTSVRTRKKAT
jgi:hypothetical protein